VPNSIQAVFESLYARTGLNFSPFYEQYDWERVLDGAGHSLLLMAGAIALSLVVGLIGAWAQRSGIRLVRTLANVYIQLFRNTPPIVQLLFFYFGIGTLIPQVDMGGWYEPLISSSGWAIIALGLFGGAYNAEIFRSGLEAVPQALIEATEALAFTPWNTFVHVLMPLALRTCLPALSTNIVSLAKTTSLAYVIAVPEMTYTLNQIWSDRANVPEMMLLLFVFYVSTVAVIAAAMKILERRLALPGYGR
jgi:polar amino acid transport system permease protein